MDFLECKIFFLKISLLITIEGNKKVVNFLDVTFKQPN